MKHQLQGGEDVTRVEEHHWQPDPPVAPRGWYPDPPMLRYWTGEAWTDEVRPARPPVPATPVQEDGQGDEDSWGSSNRRSGLRVLAPHPAGAELGSEGAVPNTAVARDPWRSRVALEEVRLEPAVPPPEDAGAGTPEAPGEASPRLLWEFTKFALVAVLALVAGALVAAVGIALTV